MSASSIRQSPNYTSNVSSREAVVAEVAALQGLSDDELYALIGTWLVPDETVLGVDDLLRKAALGRQWWSNNLAEIRELICGQPAVIALRAYSDDDAAKLATTLIDIGAHQAHLPPVAVLSMLISRIGYDRICGDNTD